MRLLKTIAALSISLAFSSCSDQKNPQELINNEHVSAEAKTGNVLPVTITHGFKSNSFNDGFMRATLVVTVDGGMQNDWIATAIILAEVLAKQGSDMIEVTVDRNDLGSVPAANMHKHLARVSYAPDLKRSVSFDKNWQIAAAENVVSIEMLNATNDYYALYKKYTSEGMRDNEADTKAGKVIAQKYKLASEWRLPLPNLRETKLNRNDIFIKGQEKDLESVMRINACMKGKVNFAIKTC
ncbi:hypothetical protein [Undibacterium luofuense]|uniref:Lipoprotein n=1 Tax=Undibacterium luofuense TaxID=2828733 RepID=A0A941DMT3_9BURK|nr:hypothetical protein [Undibacterium luofuense]MBR7782675.1 hypothetical protein [Undibacterium luofuense]